MKESLKQEQKFWERTQDLLNVKREIFKINNWDEENAVYEDLLKKQKDLYRHKDYVDVLSRIEQFDTVEVSQRLVGYGEKTQRESVYLMQEGSSGESSLCNSDDEKKKVTKSTLNIKELTEILVDSRLLVKDRIEPVKCKKHQKSPPKEWKGVFELLLYGIDRKKRNASSAEALQTFFENEFRDKSFIRIEKVRIVQYEGAQSCLIKANQESNSQFIYFYLDKNQQFFKNMLGEQLQVFRVIQNKIPENRKSFQQQQQNLNDWHAVFIRNIPKNFNKNLILQECYRVCNPIYIEDLLEVDDLKYGLVVLNSMDEAEKLIHHINLIQYSQLVNNQQNQNNGNYNIQSFLSSQMMKATLHPHSSFRYQDISKSNLKTFLDPTRNQKINIQQILEKEIALQTKLRIQQKEESLLKEQEKKRLMEEQKIQDIKNKQLIKIEQQSKQYERLSKFNSLKQQENHKKKKDSPSSPSENLKKSSKKHTHHHFNNSKNNKNYSPERRNNHNSNYAHKSYHNKSSSESSSKKQKESKNKSKKSHKKHHKKKSSDSSSSFSSRSNSNSKSLQRSQSKSKQEKQIQFSVKQKGLDFQTINTSSKGILEDLNSVSNEKQRGREKYSRDSSKSREKRQLRIQSSMEKVQKKDSEDQKSLDQIIKEKKSQVFGENNQKTLILKSPNREKKILQIQFPGGENSVQIYSQQNGSGSHSRYQNSNGNNKRYSQNSGNQNNYYSSGSRNFDYARNYDQLENSNKRETDYLANRRDEHYYSNNNKKEHQTNNYYKNDYRKKERSYSKESENSYRERRNQRSRSRSHSKTKYPQEKYYKNNNNYRYQNRDHRGPTSPPLPPNGYQKKGYYDEPYYSRKKNNDYEDNNYFKRK